VASLIQSAPFRESSALEETLVELKKKAIWTNPKCLFVTFCLFVLFREESFKDKNKPNLRPLFMRPTPGGHSPPPLSSHFHLLHLPSRTTERPETKRQPSYAALLHHYKRASFRKKTKKNLSPDTRQLHGPLRKKKREGRIQRPRVLTSSDVRTESFRRRTLRVLGSLSPRRGRGHCLAPSVKRSYNTSGSQRLGPNPPSARRAWKLSVRASEPEASCWSSEDRGTGCVRLLEGLVGRLGWFWNSLPMLHTFAFIHTSPQTSGVRISAFASTCFNDFSSSEVLIQRAQYSSIHTFTQYNTYSIQYNTLTQYNTIL
jgi:hypothetical protein